MSNDTLAYVDPGRFGLYSHSLPFTSCPEESLTTVRIYVPLDRTAYHVIRRAETGRTIRHRLGSRDILVTPAGEAHTTEWRERADVVSLQVFETFIARCVGTAPVRLRDAFTIRDAFVSAAAMQLRAALENSGKINAAFAEAIATVITCRVTSAEVVDRRIRADERITALSRRQLAALECYVDEHLNQTIVLPDLARLFDISPWHFMRRFYASLGTSPRQYVIHRRLTRAQMLLLKTDMTITETALEVGMTHSHFSRSFRSLYGVSPREFREHDRQ